jgi:hypothetical protein
MRAESPLTLFRLQPTPMVPEVLAGGRWQLGLMSGWDNYFDYKPEHFIIDVETLRLTAGIGVGLGKGFDLAVAVPVSYRGGGFMDGFIEGFERLVGVPNKNRLRFGRNQYLIHIVGPDGQVFDRHGADSGWGLEDATATLRYQVRQGDDSRPAVVAALIVKAPDGRASSLRSTGGWDVGLGLGLGQRLGGRMHLYVTASAMRYNNTELAGIELYRVQSSLSVCLEYRRSPRTSWILQSMTLSAGAVDYHDFSKATHEITLGLKRLLSKHLLFEASLLENLFVFDNSPDFGVHLGLVWRPETTRGRD